MEFPVVIGNNYCMFPDINSALRLSLNNDIGDFKNIIDLTEFIKNVLNIFKSKFTFETFLNILADEKVTNLNYFEKVFIKGILRESVSHHSSNINWDKERKLEMEDIEGEEEEDEPSENEDENDDFFKVEEKILPSTVKQVMDSFSALVENAVVKAYEKPSINEKEIQLPFVNLKMIFESFFSFLSNSNEFIRIMVQENKINTTQYELSEGVMIKDLILRALLLIGFNELGVEPSSKDDTALIREELALDASVSDEEIRGMIKSGELSWIESVINKNKKSDDLKKIIGKIASNFSSNINTLMNSKKEITNIESIKDSWQCAVKEKPKHDSFYVNIHNYALKDNVIPVFYILDEVAYSISIGSFAEKVFSEGSEDKSPQEVLESLIHSTLTELNKFFDINTRVEIFDKTGKSYLSFNNFKEFLENFYEENKSLRLFFKRVESNKNLVQKLFSEGIGESSSLEITHDFLAKLGVYLEEAGFKSRLLGFPALDMTLDSNAVIKLFRNVIDHEEFLTEQELSILQKFFMILLKKYNAGERWFSLIGTGFREDIYIGKLASLLERKTNIEHVLRMVLSVVKINLKVIDKEVVSQFYIKKLHYVFENISTTTEDLINDILELLNSKE